MAVILTAKGDLFELTSGSGYVLTANGELYESVGAVTALSTDTDRERLAFLEWDLPWEPSLPAGAT